MKSITHPQHTRSLGAPLGWDQSKVHCGSLSISDSVSGGQPVMQSQWEFEGYEGIAMMLGGKVELAVLSNVHPPVSLRAVWTGAVTAAHVDEAIGRLREFALSRGLEIKS